MEDAETKTSSGDAVDELFEIPFYGIEDQMAESMTLGGESFETGNTESTSQENESWDPFWEV